jgi:hypothetical protein
MEQASSLPAVFRALAGLLLLALLTAGMLRRLMPGPGRMLRNPELLLLSILSSFAVVSLCGLCLALAGHFSFLLLCLTLALAAAGLHLFRKGPAPAGDGVGSLSPWRIATYTILAVVAAFLYFRPSESIVGNWDPGVYLAQGRAIARDGGYRLVDRASPLMRPGEKEDLYPWQRGFPVKYPGFFVSPGRPHSLDPQFYPLYPVWIALATTFGQFRWALYLNGLFSLLSLLLVVRIGEEVGEGIGAFAAGVLFLLNPVQIWFSGFHTAEVLMQSLTLAGIWCWILWEKHEKGLLALLSGAFFGLTAFASVTGLYLAALAGLLHLLQFRKRAGHPVFFLPLAAAFPLLLVQNLFFTRQYLGQVLSFAPVFLGSLPVLAVAALPVVIAIIFRPRGLFPQGEGESSGYLRLVGTSFFLVLFALLAFGLYADGRCLRDPVFLVSKSNLLVAWAGLVVLSWRRPRVGVMLGALFVLFTVVFLLHGMMVPRYPWAFKRLLPLTLPLLAVFAGAFWGQAASRLRDRRLQAALVAAALLLAARPLYRGREFVLHRDWIGAVEAVDNLASALPAGSVVVAPKWIATPLEFLHGRKVVPLRRGGGKAGVSEGIVGLVDRLRESGDEVYFVVQEKEAAGLPFHFEEVHRQVLDTTVLSQSRRRFTTEIRKRSLLIVTLRLL